MNGVCLISHGSSVARTITNAILRAKQFVASGINDTLSTRLSESSIAKPGPANA